MHTIYWDYKNVLYIILAILMCPYVDCWQVNTFLATSTEMTGAKITVYNFSPNEVRESGCTVLKLFKCNGSLSANKSIYIDIEFLKVSRLSSFIYVTYFYNMAHGFKR